MQSTTRTNQNTANMKSTLTTIIFIASALLCSAWTPKDLPDPRLNEYLLFNGCYLDSFQWAAWFNQQHPEEKVEIRSFMIGKYSAHTVVLFTWKGVWCLRDAATGIHRGDVLATQKTKPEEVAPLMCKLYEIDRITPHTPVKYAEKPRGTKEERRCVDRAAEMVPIGKIYLVTVSEKYLFGTHVEKIPMLIWRDVEGRVQLYHPRCGTLLPFSNSTPTFGCDKDTAVAVTEVLKTYGWNVTSVIEENKTELALK